MTREQRLLKQWVDWYDVDGPQFNTPPYAESVKALAAPQDGGLPLSEGPSTQLVYEELGVARAGEILYRAEADNFAKLIGDLIIEVENDRIIGGGDILIKLDEALAKYLINNNK